MHEENPSFCPRSEFEKLSFLARYWLVYARAYYALLWAIEENDILLRDGDLENYNVWQLNNTLYQYAEASISAVEFLFPAKNKKEKKDRYEQFPFVHKFLREWRNCNHHVMLNDFTTYEMEFRVTNELEKRGFPSNYYVLPFFLLNRRLREVVQEHFKLDVKSAKTIATDATVSGLVAQHHAYMEHIFKNYKRDDLPKRGNASERVLLRVRRNIFGGGSYERFVPQDEFWSEKRENDA
jgi:hypothetical protein